MGDLDPFCDHCPWTPARHCCRWYDDEEDDEVTLEDIYDAIDRYFETRYARVGHHEKYNLKDPEHVAEFKRDLARHFLGIAEFIPATRTSVIRIRHVADV